MAAESPWKAASVVVMALAFAGCTTIHLPSIFRPETPGRTTEARTRPLGTLRASWYGREFDGRRTASGERFDPEGFTAAHPSLPIGTVLRVRNPRDGSTVLVTVNDRGPYVKGRDLDLSLAAARRLGIVSVGVARVEVEILESGAILPAQRASFFD